MVAMAGVAAAVVEEARRGARVRLLRRRGVICRVVRSDVVVGVFVVDDGRQGELRENELLLAGAVGRVLLHLRAAVAQAVDLSLVDHLARVVGFLLPDEAAGAVRGVLLVLRVPLAALVHVHRLRKKEYTAL